MYVQSCQKVWFTLLIGLYLLVPQGGANPLDRRDLHRLEPTKHLHKRADIVALWNSVTHTLDGGWVGLGQTKHYGLNPSTAGVFTTAEFYGCTVVIIVDGHGVLIGHYAQESGPPACITMDDPNAVKNNIITKLENEESWADFNEDTQAWIINSAGTNSVGYRAIVTNLQDFDVSPNNIHNFPYIGSSGIGGIPNSPLGKAVVQWTPKTDQSGGATLNLYIQDNNPTFTQDYDCNGNPVPAGNHKRDGPACTPTSRILTQHTLTATSITAGPTTTSDLIPRAAVQAGSSPVHVGTLTSTDLYTSISNALTKLCPTVSQTTEMTACKTDTVTINDIPFSDGGILNTKGGLVVKVDASAYNVTSLRDAMIKSAALTAQNSASGKNCYTAKYEVQGFRKRDGYFSALWSLGRRWLGLVERDHTHLSQEQDTWCNTASFAGIDYFGPYARLQKDLSATDYLDASWDFKVQGGDFTCEFIKGLVDALAVVTPEFAVEDVELGEAVDAVCKLAMNHKVS